MAQNLSGHRANLCECRFARAPLMISPLSRACLPGAPGWSPQRSQLLQVPLSGLAGTLLSLLVLHRPLRSFLSSRQRSLFCCSPEHVLLLHLLSIYPTKAASIGACFGAPVKLLTVCCNAGFPSCTSSWRCAMHVTALHGMYLLGEVRTTNATNVPHQHCIC